MIVNDLPGRDRKGITREDDPLGPISQFHLETVMILAMIDPDRLSRLSSLERRDNLPRLNVHARVRSWRGLCDGMHLRRLNDHENVLTLTAAN